MKSARSLQLDAVAVTALLLTSLAVGFPILNGGYRTYLDNPVHLTEIWDLARSSNGWSALAFCGFPLEGLHSPLWYGALSGATHYGLFDSSVYPAVLLLGFVAPALALYCVARRSIGPLPSLSLAYLLLVQSPSIVGLESAWGGVWTWYLAMALFILLADRLTDEAAGVARIVAIAFLLGLIGLTHLYALWDAVLLFAVVLLFDLLVKPTPWRRIGATISGGALGALACAGYWLPTWVSREALSLEQTSLSAGQLLLRLFVPTDFILLTLGIRPIRADLWYTDAVPMVLLILGGSATILFSRIVQRSSLPRIALALALLILTLLIFVKGSVHGILGLFGWRHLYVIRVALALSAIPTFAWLAKRSRFPKSRSSAMVAGLAALMTVSGFWWGLPLRHVVPNPQGQEVREVEALWAWLRHNKEPGWGRVYLQDTYICPPMSALVHSHILAQTSKEAGVHQLGAWYGVVPFDTARWTRGEFGAFFDLDPRAVLDEDGFSELMRRIERSNTGLVVVSDPRLAGALGQRSQFELRATIGRFSLFRVRSFPGAWTTALTPGLEARVVSYRPGNIDLDIISPTAEARLRVKEAWHPFWGVAGPATVKVMSDSYYLLEIGGIPQGQSRVALTWKAPKYPTILSLAGWFIILLLYVGWVYRPIARKLVRDPRGKRLESENVP